MNKQYNNIIRTFFSDYFEWSFILSFLFIASLVASIIFGNANGSIWIIPILFFIIYCFSFPSLILYFKAKKDLKDNKIEKVTLNTFKIEEYDKLEFKGRAGIVAGKRKYRLIDENNNFYFLSSSSDNNVFFAFLPSPAFSLEIEVLRNSGLVLQMKIIDDPKANKKTQKQKHNLSDFKKVFSHYL